MIVSQQAQYQDLETETAARNSAIIHFIFLTLHWNLFGTKGLCVIHVKQKQREANVFLKFIGSQYRKQ